MRAALERLDAAASLGAVVASDDDAAPAAAAQIDATADPGALSGVPVTVKDWIEASTAAACRCRSVIEASGAWQPAHPTST